MASIERSTRSPTDPRDCVRVVLFDLDGTLSDSAPGILSALRHAFAVNGLPPMDGPTERAILGPPFYESLPPLIGADKVAAVIEAYRARYGQGAMFDTRVYDGVVDVLAALRTRGVRLAVATSKPEHYAVPIVEKLGLADYFETIGGDELDGSLGTKALVIGRVLGRLGDPDRCRGADGRRPQPRRRRRPCARHRLPRGRLGLRDAGGVGRSATQGDLRDSGRPGCRARPDH